MIRPLTELELAYGLALGDLTGTAPLRPSADPEPPADALRRVMLEALQRPPTLVSFSGGRDSSSLLALAVSVARHEGLPLPVPATLRFPGVAAADEDDWQTTVLDHLGISERIVARIAGDTLDAVGPVATAALRRHGLLWPFNAHFHVPLIEQAGGGTVVTGFGGDELGLCSASLRASQVLGRQRRPQRTDLLTVGLALAPRPLRTVVFERRQQRALADRVWCRPSGRRALVRAAARAEADLPRLRWDATLLGPFWTQRYFRLCQESFDLLGSDHDARVVHPFVRPEVLRALAAAGGRAGFGSRAALVDRLFGDILPGEVVRRRTKASFTDPLWTATARDYAASVTAPEPGSCWVDPAGLRRHWRSGDPHILTTTLLQHQWLLEHPANGDSA